MTGGLKEPLRGETLRVGVFTLLPVVLEKFGLATEPLLAEVGLPIDALTSANNVLPVTDAGRLLALCAERTSCPHIGLLMGELSTTGLLGLPGMLMRSCRTLGAALQSLVMTLHFNGRAVVPFLLIEGQTAIFGITLALSTESGRAQGLDLSVSLGCQFIREIMGPDWSATEVRLAHRAPADRRPQGLRAILQLRRGVRFRDFGFGVSGSAARGAHENFRQSPSLADRDRPDDPAAQRCRIGALLHPRHRRADRSAEAFGRLGIRSFEYAHQNPESPSGSARNVGHQPGQGRKVRARPAIDGRYRPSSHGYRCRAELFGRQHLLAQFSAMGRRGPSAWRAEARPGRPQLSLL